MPRAGANHHTHTRPHRENMVVDFHLCVGLAFKKVVRFCKSFVIMTFRLNGNIGYVYGAGKISDVGKTAPGVATGALYAGNIRKVDHFISRLGWRVGAHWGVGHEAGSQGAGGGVRPEAQIVSYQRRSSPATTFPKRQSLSISRALPGRMARLGEIERFPTVKVFPVYEGRKVCLTVDVNHLPKIVSEPSRLRSRRADTKGVGWRRVCKPSGATPTTRTDLMSQRVARPVLAQTMEANDGSRLRPSVY